MGYQNPYYDYGNVTYVSRFYYDEQSTGRKNYSGLRVVVPHSLFYLWSKDNQAGETKGMNKK